MTAWNSIRSWPAPADVSAAKRAGRSRFRTWSILTVTLFLLPQSCANWASQSSYAGTKWLHSSMLSVLPAFATGAGPTWAVGWLAAGLGDAAATAEGEADADADGLAAAAGFGAV